MTQHPELLQELASRPNGSTAITCLIEMTKLQKMTKRHVEPKVAAPSSDTVFGLGVASAAAAESLLYTVQDSTLPLSPIETALTTTVLAFVVGTATATAFGAKIIHGHTSALSLRSQLALKEAEALVALDQAGINESFLRNGGLDFYKRAVESDPAFAEALISEPIRLKSARALDLSA